MHWKKVKKETETHNNCVMSESVTVSGLCINEKINTIQLKECNLRFRMREASQRFPPSWIHVLFVTGTDLKK